MSTNVPTKRQWGPGPWQNEPDDAEWVDPATGYLCRIKRAMPTPGQLNGYVAVPASHPAFGLHYDGVTSAEAEARMAHWRSEMKRVQGKFEDWQPGPEVTAFPGVGEALEKIEVHGGLTYAGAGIDPSPDRWWFGFDCAHAFDLSPGLDALMRRVHIEDGATKVWEERNKLLSSGQTYRTMDYVRNECADLARQLKALEVVVDVASYTSDRSK